MGSAFQESRPTWIKAAWRRQWGGWMAGGGVTGPPTNTPACWEDSLGQAGLPLTTSFWLSLWGEEGPECGHSKSCPFRGSRSARRVRRECWPGPQRGPAGAARTGGGGSCPYSPALNPRPVPHLTLIFLDVPPAGHPAVTAVLELIRRGEDTDGLDVLSVGDRRGQPQHGDVKG